MAGVLNVQLVDREDSFVWTAAKSFSVKYIHNNLKQGVGIPSKCRSWKLKIPLKSSFSSVLEARGDPDKDNLVKRK